MPMKCMQHTISYDCIHSQIHKLLDLKQLSIFVSLEYRPCLGSGSFSKSASWRSSPRWCRNQLLEKASCAVWGSFSNGAFGEDGGAAVQAEGRGVGRASRAEGRGGGAASRAEGRGSGASIHAEGRGSRAEAAGEPSCRGVEAAADGSVGRSSAEATAGRSSGGGSRSSQLGSPAANGGGRRGGLGWSR